MTKKESYESRVEAYLLPLMEENYVRSMGREVEVRLYKAIDRQKEFTGTLSAYDDKTVTLTMEDGSEAVFEKADIALIRLALDF